MSLTLYARELRRGVLPFFVIAAILTMYIVSVVYMYDPKITENLSLIMSTMPDAFAAFGWCSDLRRWRGSRREDRANRQAPW